MARKTNRKKCTYGSCRNVHVAKGLCNLHYKRQLAGTDMDAPNRKGGGLGWGPWVRKPNGYVARVRRNDGRGARQEQQYQHRFIMERILGRKLLKGENVHHKNGVRWDNRPENLELWVVHQPAGQRPSDLVKWAKEILNRYESAPDVV